MTTSPPVTVVLPAHNAEATIAQAIASTLQQSYADFELWVLENGSNDHTAEVARSFSDPRVRVFELGPVRVQGALQYAIEHASSTWLARMDADDLMFPNRLEVQMDFIKADPTVAFVGTAHAILTPFGHIFEPVLPSSSREVTTELLGCYQRYFADGSVVFNRQVALKAGGVDFEFTGGQDGIALFFSLLTKGKGWEIAEHLYVYRLQPSSLSRAKDHVEECYRVRAKYAPHILAHIPKPPKEPSSVWHSIAGFELLAGDGRAVRQAAEFLEGEYPTSARRMRWLSYLGRLGYTCFKWRNPSQFRYRRRADWEKLFAPFLDQGKQSQQGKDRAGFSEQRRKS
jgi:glycosyltransferase involved in cell wall biosynthesis